MILSRINQVGMDIFIPVISLGKGADFNYIDILPFKIDKLHVNLPSNVVLNLYQCIKNII